MQKSTNILYIITKMIFLNKNIPVNAIRPYRIPDSWKTSPRSRAATLKPVDVESVTNLKHHTTCLSAAVITF